MGPRQCQVCNNAPSKYKCPSCIIPYCSLSCYKKHKETPCSKPMIPMASLEKNDLPANKEAASAEQESFEEKPNEVASLVNPAISVEKLSPAPHAQRPFYVDGPGEVLQQTQLQAIAASADIRDALENEEIQNLILNIDSSQNAELELDKAMKSEVFQNFTDKILSSLNTKPDHK
uniref:HIT-type domain-containing protein n=2 Tax=Kalanchoe fedtschenkoi TaxID=63787 RepID=A0A7N0TP89_KALFE